MKLDAKQIRYLTPEDWRVLTAVEQGSRNHLVVPTTLITTLTNARGGSQISKSISSLAKSNLIARVKNASYDGYRLTYGGLDYLALHSHLKAGTIYSVGNQIGVGKESDIFVVASPGGRRLVLKIHRLGRTSFRTVKNNREYLRKGGSGTWMYMSTLAARKEWTFMRALRESGFVVPEPVGWNRHTVVMELIDAFPLRQISIVPDPATLYGQLIEMILRLAKFGLIHADFNEFNILVEEQGKALLDDTTEEIEDEAVETTPQKPQAEGEDTPHSEDPTQTAHSPEFTPSAETTTTITTSLTPILIDFPQTLSISHPNAEFYFNRDVSCIKTFFERRFHFVSDEPGPFFKDIQPNDGSSAEGSSRLDIQVEASGFSRKMAKELEKYMKEHGVDGDAVGEEGRDDEDMEGGEVDSSQDLGTAGGLQDTASSIEANDGVANSLSSLTLTPEIPEKEEEERVQPRPPPSMSTYAPSYAGTGRTVSGRPRVNPAKVARGWAI